MKKINIYVTFKQMLIILIPMILLLMVFFDSNLLIGDLKKYLTLKSENFKISKEGLFQNLLINKSKIDLYGKSFLEIDKNSTIWMLKYAIFEFNNINKDNTKNLKGGNLATYVALTKNAGNHNDLVNSLDGGSSQNIDKKAFFENFAKKFIQNVEEDDLNKAQALTLQMILISKKKSKVIINDKILAIGDKIGDAKVAKILKDKVLIKTPKEDRWLKLIN